MAEQAKVTSVEAIEAFRSNLIVFLSKARPTIEEISGDVLRTRMWLENEQTDHWNKEMRRRKRDLEQAQGELFSARLSRLAKPTASQYMAVQRAQAAVREAEEKQKLLKKWTRELENRTEPMVKLIDQLHGFLNTDMRRVCSIWVRSSKLFKLMPKRARARLQTRQPTLSEKPPRRN